MSQPQNVRPISGFAYANGTVGSNGYVYVPGGDRSPAKIAAAIENAKLGTAAVQAKIAERVPWQCQHCGKIEPAKVHRRRNKYCSMACVSAVYTEQLRGSANPNFRDAGVKICTQCGGTYRSYNPTRKFCGQACYREHYMQGKSKRKVLKFRTAPGRKDDNQDAIVEVFRQMGCKVADTSHVGFGFPDLCIGVMNVVALVEVKNPDTFYGRQGLTETQQKFHSEWEGCTHVVNTQDEAIALVQSLRSHWRNV